MADEITLKALQDASVDAKSLEEVVNGNETKQVTTRLGESYPSVKKAIKTLFESGGLPATPFATKALMTASALVDGDYAMVTDDAANNGLYIKTAGVWVFSGYNSSILSDSAPSNFIIADEPSVTEVYVEQTSSALNSMLYIKISNFLLHRKGKPNATLTWSRVVSDIADPSLFETRNGTPECLALRSDALVFDLNSEKFKLISRDDLSLSKYIIIAIPAYGQLAGGDLLTIWLNQQDTRLLTDEWQRSYMFVDEQSVSGVYVDETSVAKGSFLYAKIDKFSIRVAGINASKPYVWQDVIDDIANPAFFVTRNGVVDCFKSSSESLVYNLTTFKFEAVSPLENKRGNYLPIIIPAYGQLAGGGLLPIWLSKRKSESKDNTLVFMKNGAEGVPYIEQTQALIAPVDVYIKLPSLRILSNSLSALRRFDSWSAIKAVTTGATYVTTPKEVDDCLLLSNQCFVYNQTTAEFRVTVNALDYDPHSEVLIARSQNGQMTDGLLYNWWINKRIIELHSGSSADTTSSNYNQLMGKYTIAAHYGGIALNGITGDSIDALQLAKRFGYKYVEFDVVGTLDDKFVVMHDLTLEGSCENADGTPIVGSIAVSSKTLAEIQTNYRLKAGKDKYKRKPPSLVEFLTECKRLEITPIVESKDGKIGAYKVAQKIMGDSYIPFTPNAGLLAQAREFFSGTVMLSRAPNVDTAVSTLKGLGGAGISSIITTSEITPDLIDKMSAANYPVQASIQTPANATAAMLTGVSMQLTDYMINLDGSDKLVLNSYEWSAFATTGVLTDGELNLASGQTATYEHPSIIEYHGLDATIEFDGTISISINDVNYGTYTQNEGTIRVSRNGYNGKPKIVITSVGVTTKLKNIILKIADV